MIPTYYIENLTGGLDAMNGNIIKLKIKVYKTKWRYRNYKQIGNWKWNFNKWCWRDRKNYQC